MSEISPLLISGIVISMVFSAFFSGMEIAFVSSNRMLAEMDSGNQGIARRPLSVFYSHPNNFVSTMLVGNNIALVVYGILIARLFDSTIFSGMDAGFTVPADTILSTLIVLFTGEFLPKILFKSSPNRLLTFFAFPVYICYIVLWPVSRFATMLSRIVLRITGVKIEKETAGEAFSKLDLDYLVQTSIEETEKRKAKNGKTQSDEAENISAQLSGDENELRLFQNALDFADTKVRDCMVPRTEICAVEEDCNIEELRNVFVESGKSKIIVYKGDIDHIIGYIHSSELFKLKASDSKMPTPIDLPFVPETMTAKKLMHTFLQQQRSIGVVIDEFGGTSGIVTLEDIVEEIFGDIEDEHDNNNYIARRLADNEYMLSARLEISKINDMFQLSLPESDEYMTLGGLILSCYQSFPKLNEVVKAGPFEFKIIKNTMTKIELVRLKVNEN